MCLLRRIGKEWGPIEVGEEEDEAVLRRVVSRQLASDDMLVNGKEQMRRRASGRWLLAVGCRLLWDRMTKKLGVLTPGGGASTYPESRTNAMLGRDHFIPLYRYGACIPYIHARFSSYCICWIDCSALLYSALHYASTFSFLFPHYAIPGLSLCSVGCLFRPSLKQRALNPTDRTRLDK